MAETDRCEEGSPGGQEYFKRVDAAAAAIKEHFRLIPDTLIILGSGLGTLVEKASIRGILPYAQIPHMPQAKTPGHAGNLVVGQLGTREVAMFQGRVHCHDGLPASEVAFGLRVMISLGVKNLIVTNGAGSLRDGMGVGNLMVIENHLSVFLWDDPAFGVEHPRLGDKFYPQTDPYDRRLGDIFLEVAAKRGWGDLCHRGVYCFLRGPRYESRFDIAFLKKIGVDAVGLSTVPEVLAGLQMTRGALRILGVSTITNIAAGLTEDEPDHGDITAVANEVAPRLGEILTELVGRL